LSLHRERGSGWALGRKGSAGSSVHPLELDQGELSGEKSDLPNRSREHNRARRSVTREVDWGAVRGNVARLVVGEKRVDS